MLVLSFTTVTVKEPISHKCNAEHGIQTMISFQYTQNILKRFVALVSFLKCDVSDDFFTHLKQKFTVCVSIFIFIFLYSNSYCSILFKANPNAACS